uniref:VWFD domain-containing protein n=1 Tax=Amphiprion percula TaxID=161767 RepID=A0A3P8U9F5_AMPPE
MCGTTTTPTSTLTPTEIPPSCPEWNVANNTIEIVPYECPPIKNITCTNGKKPVLVYDEYYCCQHYVCDCVCEGWGDPHYITFDGFYYSYQGNCTYVLMEEILPRHYLKIYIDNVFCDPTEDVSCPRSLIISYGSEVALKNGKTLKLPYSQYGIKVVNTGINLVLEIPRLQVVITFGITGFSVTLPFQYFGSNTQGHCGTCTNNQADDCMLPGGQLVESCAVMADYWPTKDINQPNCLVPPLLPTSVPEPPTLEPCNADSICTLLYNSSFAECHPFVSPDNFYRGCVFDSCHVSNPAVECTSLQTYAAACAQAGVCLHWRNHTTICGKQPLIVLLFNVGIIQIRNKKFVSVKSSFLVQLKFNFGALFPKFNERFEYKCQDCICEETTKTVTCKPKVCPALPIANCTGEGFVLVNQTNPSDSCCSAYTFGCGSKQYLFFIKSTECQINTCPVSNKNCPVGYKPVISVPEGKCCPQQTCGDNHFFTYFIFSLLVFYVFS